MGVISIQAVVLSADKTLSNNKSVQVYSCTQFQWLRYNCTSLLYIILKVMAYIRYQVTLPYGTNVLYHIILLTGLTVMNLNQSDSVLPAARKIRPNNSEF